MSEEVETTPAESLATAKLRADVARQQMRLAKDQLKRARKRFKEAKREAKYARKLADIARREWKKAKRREKAQEAETTAVAEIVAPDASTAPLQRAPRRPGRAGPAKRSAQKAALRARPLRAAAGRRTSRRADRSH